MNSSEVSRRTFVSALGIGAASAAINRPPRPVKGPNDQIVLGLIGVGNQGTSRLKEFMAEPDVRIGAICDVDRRHLDRAMGVVETNKNYKPQAFSDFRRLLDVHEIDAVAIVTPDHWHAIPTVSAFEAGKDVFVEKPLSHNVAEGRAMADASLNYQRVTQMGNHIHNTTGNYRRVVELVQSGKLGRITRVHLWKTSPTVNFKTNEPPAVPEGFDYDFWLGPAPKRPYDALRSHGHFRQFWDYSGGTFIDFWCHISDVAFWALQLKAPQYISAAGGRFFLTDETEAPDTLEAILEFPNLLYIFSFRPTPLPGYQHMGHIGGLFEGSEASLVCNYETHEVWARGKKIDDFPRPPQTIPDSPGHIREFLDAIKSRDLETTCNVRYGHHLSRCGLLANIAFRTGRRIRWDDPHERIIGDNAANQYLSRHCRKPWNLKVQRRPSQVGASLT